MKDFVLLYVVGTVFINLGTGDFPYGDEKPNHKI